MPPNPTAESSRGRLPVLFAALSLGQDDATETEPKGGALSRVRFIRSTGCLMPPRRQLANTLRTCETVLWLKARTVQRSNLPPLPPPRLPIGCAICPSE